MERAIVTLIKEEILIGKKSLKVMIVPLQVN